MNFNILLFGMLALAFFSCKSDEEQDPCEDNFDSLECDQGDFDKDGVINLEDIEPTNPCEPNFNVLECDQGDFDEDGVVNAEDSDPSDPCIPNINALECAQGDFDEDGVVNGEDSDPSDPCIPNLPAFEMNVIGTWTYSFYGMSGKVKINEDGTYEDLEGEIVSNGEVTSRSWRIEEGRLFFDVGNASLMMAWLEYDCDSFLLDGMGFIQNIRFNRV